MKEVFDTKFCLYSDFESLLSFYVLSWRSSSMQEANRSLFWRLSSLLEVAKGIFSWVSNLMLSAKQLQLKTTALEA